MSNKYIMAIRQSAYFPFSFDKSVLEGKSDEEKKSYIMKKAGSAGVTVAVAATAATAFIMREKSAVIETEDGLFLSQDQFLDYEEETGVRIVSEQKPTFQAVAMERKMELAAIFAGTTGIIGYLVNKNLSKEI